MTSWSHDIHLSAEQIQAFLDGDIPAREAASVQAHVDACARCRSEMSAWHTLFDDLGGLPALAPSSAFRSRVIDALPPEGTAPVPARAASTHVPSGRLQDYLEGRLAARSATRIDAHLDSCVACRSELADYRSLVRSLDALDHVAPTPAFAERVMAQWRVEELVAVAMAPTTRWGRISAWARARTPSTRQSWAAVLGVALAPTVIVALVIRAVFSNPLVTVGNLAAFARLRLGDFAISLAGRIGSTLDAVGLGTLARTTVELLASPAAAAAAATIASALFFAALWVVYRTLIASQPADRPYAHSTH